MSLEPPKPLQLNIVLAENAAIGILLLFVRHFDVGVERKWSVHCECFDIDSASHLRRLPKSNRIELMREP